MFGRISSVAPGDAGSSDFLASGALAFVALIRDWIFPCQALPGWRVFISVRPINIAMLVLSAQTARSFGMERLGMLMWTMPSIIAKKTSGTARARSTWMTNIPVPPAVSSHFVRPGSGPSGLVFPSNTPIAVPIRTHKRTCSHSGIETLLGLDAIPVSIACIMHYILWRRRL